MQIVSDAAVLKRQAKEIERLMRKLEESGYMNNLCNVVQHHDVYDMSASHFPRYTPTA